MSDAAVDDWPSEWHAVPAEVAAGEPYPPGSFAYKVDQTRVPPGSPEVPIEAIEGCFRIGRHGQVTGEFLRNVRYVPDGDDFSQLASPDLHLEWLSDEPGAVVRRTLDELITGQLSGADVRYVQVTDRPRTRMVGKRYDLPPDQWPDSLPTAESGTAFQAMMLRAAAVAMLVTIWVVGPDGHGSLLHGVLTLVAAGLDEDEPEIQAWLEPGRTLDESEGLLDERIAALRPDR
jgi:hypothetical protein